MTDQLYTVLGKIVRADQQGQYGIMWIATHQGINIPIRRGNISDDYLKDLLCKPAFIEILNNNGWVRFNQAVEVSTKLFSEAQLKHRRLKLQKTMHDI